MNDLVSTCSTKSVWWICERTIVKTSFLHKMGHRKYWQKNTEMLKTFHFPQISNAISRKSKPFQDLGVAPLNCKSKSRFKKNKMARGSPLIKGTPEKLKKKELLISKYFQSPLIIPHQLWRTHTLIMTRTYHTESLQYFSPYEITMVHIQFVPKSSPKNP